MIMPKMGESIMEGTILKWLKKEGDHIDEDESILEIGTDKVDTEIPSIYNGKLKKILVNEGDIVQIGNPIAIIEINQDSIKIVDNIFLKVVKSWLEIFLLQDLKRNYKGELESLLKLKYYLAIGSSEDT